MSLRLSNSRMDNKFLLTILVVISLQQFQVILGQPSVAVTFTVDSITTTAATLNWDNSNSNFTGITYTMTISPINATFAISSGDGDIFGSEGSTEISGLSPGARYTITVTFSDDINTQDVIVDAFNAEPLPPTINTPNPINTNSATFSWSAADGSVQNTYVIALTSNGTGTGVVASMETTDESEELTGLASGYEYTLTVKAKSGSQESVGATHTFTTVPTAATAITFTNVVTDMMDVSWTIHAATNWDSVSLELKDLSDSSVVAVDATQTKEMGNTRQFTSLLPGHQYQVTVVVVVSSNVESDPYSETQYTKPSAPINPQVSTLGTTSVAVTWTLYQDSIQDDYKYLLNGSDTTLVRDGTTVTVPTSAGQTYSLSIQAIRNTVSSETADITFTSKPEPPIISDVTAISTTTATVSWSAGHDSTQDSYRYTLTAWSTNTQDAPVPLSVSPEDLTNLKAGESYTITIVAISNMIESDSVLKNFTTKPLPPTLITLGTIMTTTATVSWTVDTTNSIQDSYMVELVNEDKGTNVGSSMEVQSTSKDVTGLLAGYMYRVKVKAKSGNQESTEISETFITVPIAATNVRFTREDTTKLEISWSVDANTRWDECTLTIENLSELGGASSSKSITDTDSGPDLSFEFTQLKPGHQYQVSVVVVSHMVESTKPSISEYTIPLPPASVTVTAIDTERIRVAWNTSSNSDNRQDTFVVYIESNEQTCEGGITSTICIIHVTSHPAGARYVADVKSKAGTQESSAATGAGNTKPLQIVEIRVFSRTINQLVLHADKPDNSDMGSPDVSISQSSSSISIKPEIDSYVITIDGLTEGTNHVVTVTSKSGDEKGTPSIVTFATFPATPTAFKRKTATTDTLVVEWIAPVGNYESFSIVSDHSTNSDISSDVFEYTISNLPNAGALYGVTLYAKSNGLQSAAVDGYFRIKPNAPTGIQFQDVTSTSVTVTWNQPAGEVTGYSIDGNDKNENDTTYTFTNREPGAVFTVTVISKAGTQTSEEASATVVTLPNPPRSLQIDTTTIDEVTFSWLAPQQTEPVTGYRYTIVVDSDDTSIRNTTTTQVSATESNLYAGQTYKIHVFAYTHLNGQENRESSDYIEDKVTLVPKPPLALTMAERTTSMLRVTWTEPTDTIFKDYKYKVYKSSDATQHIYTASKGTTELSESSLDPGATYNVDVWTEVDDSDGAAIDSVHQQIVVTMKPNPPLNLRETAGGRTSIEVAWDPPSNKIFDEYQLTVTDTSDDSVVLDSLTKLKSVPTHQLTGLSASRTYKFSVVTISKTVVSDPIEVNFVTDSPDTPELILNEASPTSIACRWAPGEGQTVTSSQLRVEDENGDDVATADHGQGILQHTFTGLKPGRYYQVEVTITVNEAQAVRRRNIILSPLAVLNFVATKVSETEVDLNWDVDANSYQSEFVIYDGETTYSESGSSRTSRISNLIAGNWYTFTIHAKATHGDQSNASPDVWDDVTTLPRDVSSFTAVADDHDSVTLTWQPSQNSNQTSYRIWYESVTTGTPTPTTTTSVIVDSPALTHVIDDLYPGAQYKFYIKTQSGTVENSGNTEASDRLYPLPPMALTIKTTTSEMIVSWTTPASIISNYRLKYTRTGVTEGGETLTIDAADTSIIITGTNNNLVPGQNYTVSMFGISESKASQSSTNKEATQVPEMTAIVTEDAGSTRTDTVGIQYTAESGNGVFDEYIFSINEASTPVRKLSSDTDRVVRFSGLTPGTLYTVSARTQSGDQQSSVQTIKVLTVPGKPTIACSEELPDEITVLIGRPNGGVTNYIVNCNGLNCETTRTPPEPTGLLTYKPLIPFNSYTFVIAAVVTLGDPSHTKTSSSDMVTCNTVESAPEEVASFDKDVVGYDVTLTWTEPTVKNGRIRNYTLSYIGTKENNPTKEMSQTLDAAQLSYEFTNLIAGYSYTFDVLATTVKPGSSREIIHFFPILEPSIAREYIDNRDAMKPKKTGPEPSETEFVVELVNPFTDKNGKIKSYSVIVATSNQDLAKDTTLLKWSKAKEGAFESPYIAINECPDLFEAESKCHKVVTARRKREAGPTIEITIGGDQSCVPETTAYCNGKLSPNTNYYVLLRAYTETGLHADTPFSAPILTAPKDQTILIAVVCAVVAALIFIIVIVLVVILVRRKKRRSDDDPGTGMGPVSHKSSFKEPEITSIPVKIDKFDEHVTHMSADSDFRFAEEYEDLKQVGRDQSWSISELPVNRPKNRFTNILPYDHSRVKLLPTDDEEGSDYINANWMPGYNSKREFIVTQGALPATTDDFWRMMWEQNSRAIVMLTKCVERGREKCHHYWPVDSEPIFYGDLQVTVLNETKDPEWVITEFKLAKGEISRKVLHFHYTAWPDFDVPEKPQSLINFVRIVRGRVGIHGGPITVHCSAGVGRSGTYICIDRLLQVIQNTDVVDIYGIVYEMRRERCFMVQTERQYICIHQCLLCVIKGEDEDPENVYENGQVNPGFEEDDGIVMD